MTETLKTLDSVPQLQHNNEEEELKRLLLPDLSNLPLSPPSAVETNFVRYFALGNLFFTYFIFPIYDLSGILCIWELVYMLQIKRLYFVGLLILVDICCIQIL